jgi:hypothetical protein
MNSNTNSLTNVVLTPASHAVFMRHADDASAWCGQPMLVVTKAECGNVTDLKRAGLIETATDEGIVWVIFTEAGIAYAAAHGVDCNP